MKTKIFGTLLLTLFIFNAHGQSTIEEILNAISKAVKHQGKEGRFLEITTKTIQVNSSTKSWFGSGHTREVIPITLPKGTEKWYYRVTVLNYDQDYSYQNNETFSYLLLNNKPMDIYNPTSYGVDFFILEHSGDVASFQETGNN